MAEAAIVVRAAVCGDAAEIASIYAHHVAHGTASFDFEPPTLTEFERRIMRCSHHSWPFLLAEQDGIAAGYAYVTQFRDKPVYASACENSIYINPALLGRGIGSRLLGALIAAASRAEFRQMIAVIGGGEPASVALHRGAGFVDAGRMRSVGRKFGRWLDVVYMQLELGHGDRRPPSWEPSRGRAGISILASALFDFRPGPAEGLSPVCGWS